MVEVGLLRRPGRGIFLGMPRVEVRFGFFVRPSFSFRLHSRQTPDYPLLTVKMEHPYRLAIDAVKGTKGGQCDAVIASQSDELRLPQQRRDGPAVAELSERLRHLDEGDGVVHGRYGDVSAVDYLGPAEIGVDIRSGVEAPERGLPARGEPNRTRTEASTYSPDCQSRTWKCALLGFFLGVLCCWL